MGRLRVNERAVDDLAKCYFNSFMGRLRDAVVEILEASLLNFNSFMGRLRDFYFVPVLYL